MYCLNFYMPYLWILWYLAQVKIPYCECGTAVTGCRSGEKCPRIQLLVLGFGQVCYSSMTRMQTAIFEQHGICLFLTYNKVYFQEYSFNHLFCCFCFQSYLLYLFQDTASLTLTSASLPSFETLLCTASHWCRTMPLIQIPSSILPAPLFHHPPATCSPSHLTASATPTHQKAPLDQEVPISSRVRMSFGTPLTEAFQGLTRAWGQVTILCSPQTAAEDWTVGWNGLWIWFLVTVSCVLCLSPSDRCSRDWEL